MPHPPLAIPAVGRGEEKGISATIAAYNKVGEDAAGRGIDTFVVITPHGPCFKDAVAIMDAPRLHGDMRRFRVPQTALDFDIDGALVKAIDEKAGAAFGTRNPLLRLNEATARRFGVAVERDWGALVPLWYATGRGGGAPASSPKIVHITYGGIPLPDLYKLGACIREACPSDNIAVIASGDLSHRLTRDGPYEYSPRGKDFDAAVVAIIKQGAFDDFLAMDGGLVEEAGQCGYRSFVMLAGMAGGGTAVKSQVLSYEGPFGVGYCVALGSF
jgi:aromatic ring-opening dioxygenase LigB subunit